MANKFSVLAFAGATFNAVGAAGHYATEFINDGTAGLDKHYADIKKLLGTGANITFQAASDGVDNLLGVANALDLTDKEQREAVHLRLISDDVCEDMDALRAKYAKEKAERLAKKAKKDSSKEEKKNQPVKVETSSSKEDERIVAIEKDLNNLKANVEEIVSFIRKVQEQANQQ